VKDVDAFITVMDKKKSQILAHENKIRVFAWLRIEGELGADNGPAGINLFYAPIGRIENHQIIVAGRAHQPWRDRERRVDSQALSFVKGRGVDGVLLLVAEVGEHAYAV